MFPYTYSPLKNPNNIRLLQLLPAPYKSASIQCELFEYTLPEEDQKSHLYDALSYVWGDESDPESITIIGSQGNGSRLSVTVNLYKALLHLRDQIFPRVLWVDAVCINQEDKIEQTNQISLMASIYATASRVTVWLGEPQDNSSLALEAIQVAAENSSSNIKIQQLEAEAIRQLLNRPWFRRIWVRN
jgi:heterokaryon incompatibility protein (HET)